MIFEAILVHYFNPFFGKNFLVRCEKKLIGNRLYTLQTRDSLNQCFCGGSFVSTATFSVLNRTENIISRSKL